MPYVQKLSEESIAEQIYQWEGVMHDRRLDGYNGWACKQKIYKLKFLIDEAISNAPSYYGEEKWLTDQRLDIAQKKLSGR